MAWTKPTPSELAADFIASQRDPPDPGSGDLAQLLFPTFPLEEPDLTWTMIKLVIQAYPEVDYYAELKTEAQTVVGVLAAGPIEDLLSCHGEQFIERFESDAQEDRRMAWALGGAWQFQMSDHIWKRVQLAADRTYWERKISG
jgi:hypothetical protein